MTSVVNVSGGSHHIVIKRVFGQELADAVELINKVGMEREGAKPPPPPEFLFAVLADGKPVATLGAHFWEEGRLSPLGALWEFDPQLLPGPLSQALQYRCWITSPTNPIAKTSEALLYLMSVFGKAHGKTFSLSEAKPYSARLLRVLGLRPRTLEDASIRSIAHIEPAARPYYEEDPTPVLCVTDLTVVEEVLRPQLPQPLLKGIQF